MSETAAFVGLLTLRFRLPARTLKEKRAIVKSVLARVRDRYNASAAEIAELDSPGFTTIGLVCLSNDAAHAESMLQEIARFVEAERLDAELLSINTEVMTL